MTLLVVWSNAEAARYVETLKLYEKTSADAIMERPNTDFLGQVTDALTAIRSVNKTDVSTLVASFGVRGVESIGCVSLVGSCASLCAHIAMFCCCCA